MSLTILITGATDGIGLETAKSLYKKGHRMLLHGRNPTKLEETKKEFLYYVIMSVAIGILKVISVVYRIWLM